MQQTWWTKARLLDHLVGAGEQCRRDDEAERSRGFEIHGQLKFGGLHYRQVRSVLALENPASIRRRLAIGVRQVGAVTHEAAGKNIFAPSVQRSHAVPRSKRDNPFTLAVEKWVGGNNKHINAVL